MVKTDPVKFEYLGRRDLNVRFGILLLMLKFGVLPDILDWLLPTFE